MNEKSIAVNREINGRLPKAVNILLRPRAVR